MLNVDTCICQSYMIESPVDSCRIFMCWLLHSNFVISDRDKFLWHERRELPHADDGRGTHA